MILLVLPSVLRVPWPRNLTVLDRLVKADLKPDQAPTHLIFNRARVWYSADRLGEMVMAAISGAKQGYGSSLSSDYAILWLPIWLFAYKSQLTAIPERNPALMSANPTSIRHRQAPPRYAEATARSKTV